MEQWKCIEEARWTDPVIPANAPMRARGSIGFWLRVTGPVVIYDFGGGMVAP